MSKICPLMFTSTADLEDFECRPDRCAWAYAGRCAMYTIAECLNDLVTNGIIVGSEEDE